MENQNHDKEKKVNIKVEKHLWPDEVAARRRAARSKIISIAVFSVVFLIIGIFVGKSLFYNANSGLANSKYEQIEKIMSEDWYFGKDIPDLNEKVNDQAMKGLSDFPEYDIHTYYLSNEEMQQFTEGLSGAYVGIGIQYYKSENENLIVQRVFENSPAKEGGLKAGDILLKVNDKSLEGMSTEEVANIVMGKEGSTLTLTVAREGVELDVDLTRATVLHSVFGEVINGTGYIELDQFGESSAEEVINYLNKFEGKQDKLILDLRDNGGGYLDSVVDIASYLIDKDEVVLITENSQGKTIEEKTNYDKKYEFEDIVVLVNENTASASEVLTAALAYHLDNVTVVGTNTYGKGTVQQSKIFDDGSAMKYTTAEWLTPNGEKINKVGIKPDIEINLHPILTAEFALFEEEATYEYDDVGEPIETVQMALDFLGYDVDRSDGYMDTSTKKAIEAYQKDREIPVNGILDQEIYEMLISKTIREWTENKNDYDTQLEEALLMINGE